MLITAASVRQAIQDLGLTDRLFCLHSSLRSFGNVAGGSRTIPDGLLAEGCTMLVPTFSWEAFAIPPPPDLRPARNGWRYDDSDGSAAGADRVYSTASAEIDREMGAIPATVLRMPEHTRGDHPLCSFGAIGPAAAMLTAGQRPRQVYAPLQTLAGLGGCVICMGVGLTRMTLIHLAEQQAGRRLFRRWANGPDGRPIMVDVGGCSEGFARFDEVLLPVERRIWVGMSRWRVFPVAEALNLAAGAIRVDPAITHCGNRACGRCDDAVAGGPLTSAGPE